MSKYNVILFNVLILNMSSEKLILWFQRKSTYYIMIWPTLGLNRITKTNKIELLFEFFDFSNWFGSINHFVWFRILKNKNRKKQNKIEIYLYNV